MSLTRRVDWDANDGALALRLNEELRNDETIRRALWRRKKEPHRDTADRHTTAIAVAKALFPLETDVNQLTFYACAVTERIKIVRHQFHDVKKVLQNGEDIDWEMETVRGLPVERKWAKVLRRCPHFRTYAFFNGAISESEIRGSASDVDPLTLSTKPLSPQDDPNALNEKPAPHSHRGYTKPSVESDETDDEYRDSDSEGNDWEKDDEEPDEEEINQGARKEELEEEVMIIAADRVRLRESSARLARASCSITPTARNHSDIQPGKRHREASPHTIAMEDVGIRREKMQFDHNYKMEKRRWIQKEKERKMEFEELDKARKHEERMIDKRIKLAKIERGKVNKG